MAGVAGIAQPVNNPELQVSQRRPALLGDVVEIGRVGCVAYAIAERRNMAVPYLKSRHRHRAALPFDGAALAGLDRMTVQDRRIVASLRRDEAIGKPRHDVFRGRLIEINRNPPSLMQHDRAEIVDAVGLVGVLVGQEYRIDVIDVGVDQLLAQVGRGIDHDPRGAVRAGTLDHQRAAAATVFWIVGIAGAPAEGRSRYAGGGAAAEDGQRYRHAAAFGIGTFENSRKKFSVVCREISSSETPRVSASTFATSTT